MPRRLFSKSNIIAALSAVVLFTSCKKDHVDNPDNGGGGQVPEKKIASFYQNEQNKVEFSYNASGRLSKVFMRNKDEEDQLEETLNIDYSGDGKISKVSTDGFRVEYSYLNGNLDKTVSYNENDELVATAEFKWQNGKLSEYSYFMQYPTEDGESFENRKMNETTYEYSADGNVKKVKMKQLNILTNQLEDMGYHIYDAYDNKVNPLKHLKDFSYGFFQEFNSANVLKETAYDKDGNILEKTERTYTYDQSGYPLTCVEKRTETGKPEVTENTKFTYY